MVTVKHIRRNPRIYFIVGGAFIVLGVTLCIAPASIRSFSNYSPPWLVGIVFFIIAGISMTYGKRLRLLQTLTPQDEIARQSVNPAMPESMGTDRNFDRNCCSFFSSRPVFEQERPNSPHFLQEPAYPRTLEAGFMGSLEPPAYSSVCPISDYQIAGESSADSPPPYEVVVRTSLADDAGGDLPAPPSYDDVVR